jgi:hypothetical protein
VAVTETVSAKLSIAQRQFRAVCQNSAKCVMKHGKYGWKCINALKQHMVVTEPVFTKLVFARQLLYKAAMSNFMKIRQTA